MATATVESRRRWVMLCLALACIALQAGGSLGWAALSLAIWLIVLAFADRHALRRMWMPRFWMFTLVFATGSGLLLGPRDTHLLGVPLSTWGLRNGVLMMIRGGFVFALASWASRALAHSRLKPLAARLGAGRLLTAVEVAFSLLPELRLRLQRIRKQNQGRYSLGALHTVAAGLVTETARLADDMARLGVPVSNHRTLLRFAVIGAPDSGKTRVIEALTQRLMAQGFQAGGVDQPKVLSDGKRLGYRMRDLSSDEQIPFASAKPGGIGFDFAPAAWDWARERILSARRQADVLVVDELGLLEAAGKGHLPALLEPTTDRATIWLLGVREGCEQAIQAAIGSFDDVLRIQPGVASSEAGLERLLARLELVRSGC